MLKKRLNQAQFTHLIMQWIPIILTICILILVPPLAIAVILAYFTLPILLAVRSIFRLPLTIATIFVMILMLFLLTTFFTMLLYGLWVTIPIVENKISPLTENTDFSSKLLLFVKDEILSYGHNFLEHAVTFVGELFQKVFSIFIFLVAYFFALRESGKNRFWFLVYFPTKLRPITKKIVKRAGQLIGTFIFVEARLFLFTYIILAIGFYLLSFESPFGSAFLISLVDSLPLLGIGIFLIPMSIFFFYTNDLTLGIAMILLYFFVLMTRQFIESYLWASTFRVQSIHAFMITACSFYLFGLAGIILTPFLLFAAIRVREHALFKDNSF